MPIAYGGRKVATKDFGVFKVINAVRGLLVWKRLNGGTVPPFRIHSPKVSPFSMHLGETEPLFKMHPGKTQIFYNLLYLAQIWIE